MGSLCVKCTYSLLAYIYFNELLATKFPSWDIIINEKQLHAVGVNCSLLYKVFVISIRKSK